MDRQSRGQGQGPGGWQALIASFGPWLRAGILGVVLAGLWLVAGQRGGASTSPPLALSGDGLGAALKTTPGQTSAGGGAGGAGAPVRRYVIHVAGAVKRPGVYRVRAPSRLIDAVERAGGMTADADPAQINLAAKLTDGKQVVVPSLSGGGAGGGGAGAPGVAGSGSGGAAVSLSAASAEELQTLDGVGPATAAAIIKARTELGGFTSFDQLLEVPGIGPKRLESLQAQAEL